MANKSNRKDRVNARAESRRAQRVIQARNDQRKRLLTIIGGVVGGAIVIALLFVLLTRDSTPAAANEPVQAAPAPVANLQTDGMTEGDPNAPVRVVEYGDFQ